MNIYPEYSGCPRNSNIDTVLDSTFQLSLHDRKTVPV